MLSVILGAIALSVSFPPKLAIAYLPVLVVSILITFSVYLKKEGDYFGNQEIAC